MSLVNDPLFPELEPYLIGTIQGTPRGKDGKLDVNCRIEVNPDIPDDLLEKVKLITVWCPTGCGRGYHPIRQRWLNDGDIRVPTNSWRVAAACDDTVSESCHRMTPAREEKARIVAALTHVNPGRTDYLRLRHLSQTWDWAMDRLDANPTDLGAVRSILAPIIDSLRP